MAYRSRERVARILAHRDADRIPFDSIGFHVVETTAALCDELGLGADEREYFTEGEFRYLEFAFPDDRERFAAYLPGLPEGALVDEFGVGRVPLSTADGYVAGHTYFNPLARINTLRDLGRYPFPDVTRPACHAHLDEAVKEARRREFTVVGQMSQTFLEISYCMRGMEQLFCDFTERPDYVRALFELIAERRVFQARRFAEAGVDVLRIGDDIATQVGLIIGPPMYREWIKPYHARVVAAARAVNPDIQVLYHSDGALTPLLPDLIEAGVTAVNPCQPEAMPPMDIKRRFGDRLTLWGCTATQSTYAAGSGAEVEEELRRLLRDVGRSGGLVVQFYNMLMTPRVRENLGRFLSTFLRIQGS
jgi:uroporphyrinogen decarboxylase